MVSLRAEVAYPAPAARRVPSRWAHWLLGASLGLLVAGCQPESEPTWSTHFDPPAVAPLQTGSGQAFDEYAAAALDAEQRAGDRINRVHWTPGFRRDLIRDLDEPTQQIYRAQGLPFAFRHQPSHGLDYRPYVRGWRLIGQAMIWRYQESLREDRREEAINWARAVLQFGAHLQGGGVEEATLGITLQSDLRRAIAEDLSDLTAAELTRIAEGALEALRATPAPSQMLEHEHQNWLASVQYVQERARQGEVEALGERLGPQVRRAVDYLRNLSPQEQADYFRAFAEEVGAERERMVQRLAVAPVHRPPLPRPEEEEPLRYRLRQHLAGNAREFEPLYDLNLARMRMFIVSLRLEASIKNRVSIPRQLAAFDQDLREDPFSGREFVYRAEGSDYKLYSVGPNQRDDGGDTDELALEPDLWWEVAALDRPN